jgi:2-keto-4-pentenoate hydratase/2-oxohepta-3-ene-1,7-dioic acid hydratase in catechol pathway
LVTGVNGWRWSFDGERRLLDFGLGHERVRGGDSAPFASMLALISGLELGQFLNPGDVIELEVERIGVLRNRIIKER